MSALLDFTQKGQFTNLKQRHLLRGASVGIESEARMSAASYPKQLQTRLEGLHGGGRSSPLLLNYPFGMPSSPFCDHPHSPEQGDDANFSEYAVLDLETDLSLGPLLTGTETGDLLSPFCSQSISLAVDIDNIFDICDNSDNSSLGSVGSPDTSVDSCDSPFEMIDSNGVNNNDGGTSEIQRTDSNDSDLSVSNFEENSNNGDSDPNTRQQRKRNKRYSSDDDSDNYDENDVDYDGLVDDEMLSKLKARPRRKRQSNLSQSKKPMGRICASCQTTKTPQWRKGPNGVCLCNACGLHVKHKLAKDNNNTTTRNGVVGRKTKLSKIEAPLKQEEETLPINNNSGKIHRISKHPKDRKINVKAETEIYIDAVIAPPVPESYEQPEPFSSLLPENDTEFHWEDDYSLPVFC